LADRSGKVLAEARILTKEYPDIKKFVVALSEAINELLKKDHELIGIGIGAPNAHYYKGTIELARIFHGKGLCPLQNL